MSKYAPHRNSTNQPRATSSTICQKCLQTGHFIYQCKSTRPYVSRPSRTKLLEKPALLAKLNASGKTAVDVPDEFKTKSGTANKILEAKEKEREKEAGPSKKKARRSSDSGSSSSSSGSDSDSDSSSSSSSSSGSDSSDSDSSRSRSRDRRRRVPSKRDPSPSRSTPASR